MTVEEAGVLYLQAVCPTNFYNDRTWKAVKNWALSSGELNAKNVAFFVRGADVARQGASLLDSPEKTWPEDVRKGVSQVVVALLQDVSSYTAAAKAKTKSEAYTDMYGNKKRLDNSQAQLVRLRLGLPAADAKKDGCGPYKTFTP